MHWDPFVALIVAAAGLALLGLIYLLGSPRRSAQGRRLAAGSPGERREPSLDGDGDIELDAAAVEAELARINRSLEDTPNRPEGGSSAAARPGERAGADFEKIVTVYLQAPEGELICGADLVVAAEKAGLTFGAMNIFHRLVDGKPALGPIFSVASMIKPGSFDLTNLDGIRTPGLSFFLTLPGPLPGLDAWDTMLPAAQRMAELLGAQVLDDRRNPISRQRIAHLRDELRAYDRKHEAQVIRSER